MRIWFFFFALGLLLFGYMAVQDLKHMRTPTEIAVAPEPTPQKQKVEIRDGCTLMYKFDGVGRFTQYEECPSKQTKIIRP